MCCVGCYLEEYCLRIEKNAMNFEMKLVILAGRRTRNYSPVSDCCAGAEEAVVLCYMFVAAAVYCYSVSAGLVDTGNVVHIELEVVKQVTVGAVYTGCCVTAPSHTAVAVHIRTVVGAAKEL